MILAASAPPGPPEKSSTAAPMLHLDPEAWLGYTRDLGKLARLARLPATPRRIAMLRSLEERLIEPAKALATEAQRTATLRVAITIGSTPLLEALSPCPPATVGLDAEAWRKVCQNASAADFRRALDLGLKLDHDGLAVLLTHGHRSSEISSVLVDTVAKAQWWYGESTAISKRWFSITDPRLAAAFLRAQCAAYPEKTDYLFYTFMSVGAHLPALIIQRSGGVSPAVVAIHGDPAIPLREKAPSNHERLAWEKTHADLESIHRAYNRR